MPDDQTFVKSGPTVYSPDRVANARSNVDAHEWAARRADDAVARADRFLERHGGLDGIWNLVTGQEIPRSCAVSDAGSPLTGETLITEYGGRSWIGDGEFGSGADAFDGIEPPPAPWTLVDPSSGYVFPTNDFAAYRESGRDERGFFDPELADDALLVNERYPDKPDDWGVDDGWGWTDADGNTYTFVAFYNHFHVWYEIRFMARAFREAYLLTGETRHARAGTVLLDRIADVYPALDLGAYPPDAPFYNSHGSTGQGRTVGSIWETASMQAFLRCYDAVFAGQPEDDELVAFLDGRTDDRSFGQKASIAAIRANIEGNLVQEVLPAVQRAQIRGNFGSHQATLALSAVVADDPDGYTEDTLDFLFRQGGLAHEDDGTPHGRYRVTGGEVLSHVVDEFDRDGFHWESPNYNTGKPQSVARIAAILDNYDEYDGVDLIGNPKVRKMQEALIHLVMCNRYYPHIGDSDGVGDPGLQLPNTLSQAFKWYGDPIYAQALALQGGRTGETDESLVEPDIFEADPDEFAARLEAVLEADGPLDLPSENLAGFGFAALRDGEIDPSRPDQETRREAWMHYGRHQSFHNHADILSIGLFANGLDLLPDLGYPEKATGGYPKHDFTMGTIAHNTVVVDDESQGTQWVGEPRGFGSGSDVQFVDVEAPAVYAETDTYRRMVAMVRIDDERSYLVDVFRIAGGDEHLYSFHATEGETTVTGVALDEQDGGTYAGPGIDRPARGEDTEYNRTVGNGYNYLDRVERDGMPPDRFAVEWDVTDTWGVRSDGASDVAVRLTTFGPFSEVALADGHPPAKPGNPERLRYVLARRSGTDLTSTFTSVIEQFEEERGIERIETVEVTDEVGHQVDPQVARAVRVIRRDGREDYIISTMAPDRRFVVDDTIEMAGAFGYLSRLHGAPVDAYLHRGTSLVDSKEDDPVTLIQEQTAALHVTVDGFTESLSTEHAIDVTVENSGAMNEEVSPGDVVGEWIYLDVSGERNGAYRIEGVDVQPDGRWQLDVGDVTTVREFVDPEDPDAGYTYLLERGDTGVIPLSRGWSA